MDDGTEPELGHYTGHLSSPVERGHTVSSRKRDFPSKPGLPPAQGHAWPSTFPRRAGPRPPPPALPSRPLPRAAGDSNSRSGALTSVRVFLQVLLQQREVCAKGREERPGQRLRDTARRPRRPPSRPRAPPRAEIPRRLQPGNHSGRRQTSGRGEAAPPPPPRHPENRGPRTRHLVVAPSSSVSRVSGAKRSGASREPVDVRGRGGEEEGRAGGGARAGRAEGP